MTLNTLPNCVVLQPQHIVLLLPEVARATRKHREREAHADYPCVATTNRWLHIQLSLSSVVTTTCSVAGTVVYTTRRSCWLYMQDERERHDVC